MDSPAEVQIRRGHTADYMEYQSGSDSSTSTTTLLELGVSTRDNRLVESVLVGWSDE